MTNTKMKNIKSSTHSLPHPRIIFPSIEIAKQSSPFFIDEEQIGPWLSPSESGLQTQGVIIMTSRNAIHLPSLQQNGKEIPSGVITELCNEAVTLGLNRFKNAIGYWTLASSGVLQTEKVKIAYSDRFISPDRLYRLAQQVLQSANQEAVAIEVSGKVIQFFGE